MLDIQSNLSKFKGMVTVGQRICIGGTGLRTIVRNGLMNVQVDTTQVCNIPDSTWFLELVG